MMDRDPWKDDIYDNFFDSFSERYIERRKRVDDLQIEWLDVVKMYSSPEVVMYSREEILEQSNWTEEDVMLLFADRRFPMMRFASLSELKTSKDFSTLFHDLRFFSACRVRRCLVYWH